MDASVIDRLPNLIILGAQKCGTTTLHATLAQHPAISMSQPKEVQFFTWHWERGPEWYATHFGASPVRGEATPEYTAHPMWPEVPERIASLLPDARLVYLVRDPVERIVSHWTHAVGAGREDRSFVEAVTDGGFGTSEYANRTRYWCQISRYLDLFPADHVLALSLEALQSDRTGTLAQVLAHVGLDPDGARALDTVHENVGTAHKRPPWVARRIRQRGGDRAVGRAEARLLAVLRDRFGTVIERPVVTEQARTRVLEALTPDLERFAAAFPAAAPWVSRDR